MGLLTGLFKVGRLGVKGIRGGLVATRRGAGAVVRAPPVRRAAGLATVGAGVGLGAAAIGKGVGFGVDSVTDPFVKLFSAPGEVVKETTKDITEATRIFTGGTAEGGGVSPIVLLGGGALLIWLMRRKKK